MLKKECEDGMKVQMKNGGSLLWDKGDIFTIKEANPIKYPRLVDLGGFFCSPKNFEKVNKKLNYKFKEGEIAFREPKGICIIEKRLDRMPEKVYLIFLKEQRIYETVFESQLSRIKNKAKYEIGDEALWLDRKVTIFGVQYRYDKQEYEYFIKINIKGEIRNYVVYENDLETLSQYKKEKCHY
jgi:hypothetical protein